MKASIIKKLMVGALTAALVMAPAMGVFAASSSSSSAAIKARPRASTARD